MGTMSTFLLKTEPGAYSWDDLVRDGETEWTGVTNPAALKHMRCASVGDDAFLYHTGEEKRIVGLARIVSAPKDVMLGGRKSVEFRVKPLKPAKTPVTLAMVKADKRFAAFALVREPRLSVMPVPSALDAILRALAGLPGPRVKKGA